MKLIGVLAAAALCLNACTKQVVQPAPVAIASVAGQSISEALFNAYVLQKTGVVASQVDATRKSSLLQDLEQLKAAAVVEESNANPGTREALELQRIELLAHAGAVAAGVYAPPSDADLKAEYDRFVASLPANEFHVAHVLVATEANAQVIVVKIQGGVDFAKLASEQSADDSKAKGGDLGWIAPGKLPAEFTKAVESLKPGQITSHPVHTVYGWHVIKLLETRPGVAPPFDQVKAQLATNLQQTRYKQFLEAALANAKVAKGS